MNGFLFIVHNEESVVHHHTIPLANCRDEIEVEALRARWQIKVGEDWTVLDSRDREEFVIPKIHPAWIGEKRRFNLLRSFWTEILLRRRQSYNRASQCDHYDRAPR